MRSPAGILARSLWLADPFVSIVVSLILFVACFSSTYLLQCEQEYLTLAIAGDCVLAHIQIPARVFDLLYWFVIVSLTLTSLLEKLTIQAH
eukprot:scaffold87493_cov25-Tisochrysis_lutea.AAC.1